MTVWQNAGLVWVKQKTVPTLLSGRSSFLLRLRGFSSSVGRDSSVWFQKEMG